MDYPKILLRRGSSSIKGNNNNILLELGNRFDDLHLLHKHVRSIVDYANRNERHVVDEVYMWLGEVTNLVEEAEKLLQLCRGRSSLRSTVNREVGKMMEKISTLLQYGKFDKLFYQQPEIVFRQPNILEGLESRMSVFRELMELLSDEDVGLIEVQGMGGVGKTTLVKEVGRCAVEEGLFDVTVWSVVSEAPYVRRIQDEITERLGLRLDREASEAMRASKIHEMLTSSERKVLVILDNVREGLDLESIGIPMESGRRRVLCKVLLISRNIDILSSMDHKIISVRTLPIEEAFFLFDKIVGETESAYYSDSGRRIVECCEGLPLAIAVVAQQLKRKSLSESMDAWQMLSRSVDEFDYRHNLFSILKFSYDYLRNEEEKFIFLLCSILGEQIDCEDVLKYALGLGLFQGAYTVKSVRDRIFHLLNSLKESRFLEDGKTSQHVTMHDLVRNFAFALAVASRADGDCFIVEKHSGQILLRDDMANFGYISLQISNGQELPEGLLFPTLKLLHVYDENRSLRIPNSFFIGTRGGLRVLALIKMQLLSLPSSLLVLTNLDTLCLDYCVLGDISMIGELRTLRLLSLSHTNVEQLPKQIGQLTRLCLLDLSNCLNLNLIPPNVLSNLTQLQDLRMENSFTNWEVGVNNERSNASLVELTSLKFLTALKIHILDAKMIPNALPWDHLDRYNIKIGQDFLGSSEREVFKVLKLNLHKEDNNDGSEHWIKSLLKSCEQLRLKECNGFMNLNGDVFGPLKHLHIQDNDELEYLTPKVVFDALESLVLKNLINFRGILCRDSELLFQPFSSLTVVRIECCPWLELVFNVSTLDYLFQLRELEVNGCKKMVAIANIDRDDVEFVDGQPFCDGVPWNLELPHLHALTLQNLDNLSGFFTSEAFGGEIVSANIESISFFNLVVVLARLKHLKLISVPRIRHLIKLTTIDQAVPVQILETMEIVECNDLCYLLITEGLNIDENYGGLLPELRQLCLRNLSSFRSILGDNPPRGILKFKMLNRLTVCCCNQMTYFLPLYVLENLEQLQNIDISQCAMLERVFGYDEDTMTTESNKTVLPLLRSLRLSNLPKLASICSGARHIISCCLKHVTIEDCPKLGFSFAYSGICIEEAELITVRSVESLNLRQLNHLKMIWNDRPVSIMHLKSLQLYKCDYIEYVFSLSVAERLPSLQELKIISCERVKQIVVRETATAGTVEFPKLNTLFLEKLPKFSGFCQDGCVVKWLSLKMLRVIECPEIKKSSLGTVDRPLLKSVKVINCKPWEKEHLEHNIVHLFVLTDELSALEELAIEDSENLKKYMEMELQESSFTQLKMLKVGHCDDELNKLLSILLHRSHGLERLIVENSELLEQVFDLGQFIADEKGQKLFSNLQRMRFFNLPKLKCIWNKDPSGIIELSKLVKLEIIKCGLRKIPVSTALVENLKQLEELNLDSCEMIEEVIGEDMEKQERSFPKLKNLRLVSLPKFMKFNSGNCNLRLPNLLSLRIENCPKMNAFTTGFLSTQTPTIEGTSDPILDKIMDVCPKLQKLNLAGLDTFEEIWPACFSATPVCELKELELDALCNLKYIFPSSMLLTSLEKLETLVVRNCISLSNIVFQLSKEKDMKLANLTKLVLDCLPTLEHVFENDSIMVFEKLEILQVKSCGSLRNLLLSSSCLNLRAIEISDCNILEKISIGPEDKSTDKKSPPLLESIVLENLPMLSSFSVETFEYPSVIKVRIVNCPLLKTFSRNNSTTADKFFSDLDSFENLEELHLINVGGCQNIGNSYLSSSSSLCKLKIVPFNTLIKMLKLKKITVQSCDALEVLFDINMDSQSGAGAMKLLPQLDGLELSDPSNMQKLKRQNLKKNTVQSSDALEVLFDINKNSQSSPGAVELLPQLDELELSDLSNMQQVWKQEPNIPIFRKLTSLEIIRCRNIKNLFSISVAKHLDVLKLLKLYECDNMVHVLQGGGEKSNVVFQNLECLVLKHLPYLTSFCEEECDFKFPELKMVRVGDIPQMNTFVKKTPRTPKLKEVYITYLTKCWLGDLNKTITYLHENQDFSL